jgi:hypothetical protein
MKHHSQLTAEEEEALRSSTTTTTETESSEDGEWASGEDPNDKKIRVKVVSNVLGKQERALILCFNCRDGHFDRTFNLSGPRKKNKLGVMREIDDQFDLRKK